MESSEHDLNEVNPLARQHRKVLIVTALIIVVAFQAGGQTSPAVPAAVRADAQAPGTQDVAPPNEPARRGGFVPGQKRPPGDPVQIARGKTLYGINCRGCHGADLRGGDMGGPNLLRSQVALSDQQGELIVPIIHGSRQKMGMPAIPLNDADANAAAAYVRSVIESIEVQGAPPSAGLQAPNVLVGNASEGRAYFAAKCSSCHSGANDLSGIGARIPDPKRLQNTWLAGGGREQENESNANSHTVTAAVTLPSGEVAEGQLLRIDDFQITLQLGDKSQRTYRRSGDVPTVAIHDPLKAHRDLLSQYSNKDVHDVTAYLVTLK